MIYIVTGHYGSGKTEVAIQLARSLQHPVMIDLDIVNPYFRTKDAEETLNALGIRLIAPVYANTNLDIPALPPDIYGALQGDDDVVIDVGGDDDGAIALGQYYPYFAKQPYEMIFVVNAKRPMTATAEDVIDMIRKVEAKSRLKVTSLINSTNLKEATTVETVLEGQKVVEEVMEKTALPQRAIAAKIGIAEQIQADVPVMPLELQLSLPWEV